MKFRLGIMGMFLSSFLILSGCGENLFSSAGGSSSTTSISGLNRQLDIASSPSDYTPIINGARNIISNSSSTSSDIKQAKVILAQAIIGRSNVPILELFADVFADLNSNSLSSASLSSQSQELSATDVQSTAENIYQTVGNALEAITSSDSREAANAFNDAYEIAQNNPSITLSDDELIIGGMINLMAITRGIDQYLEITSSSVSIKDQSQTISEIIELVMNPYNLSLATQFSGDISAFIAYASRNGIDQYSNYAFLMLNGTSAIPSDMQTFLEEHFEATFDQLLLLYEAMLESNGTYTYSSVTYEVGTSYSNRNDDILDAIEAIFSAALN